MFDLKLTPHKPLIKIIKIADDMSCWCDEVAKHVKRIFSVYAYDALRIVHCCSLEGSFELHFLTYDWELEDEELDEEIRDKVYDMIEGAQCDPVIYWNPRNDIETIQEGFLPKSSVGEYKLYQTSSWESEKRVEEDRLDAEYQKQTNEEWEFHYRPDEKVVAAWKKAADEKTAEAIEEAIEWACTKQL